MCQAAAAVPATRRSEGVMHATHQADPTVHGVMAEFDTAQTCVDAARRVSEEGYKNFEAYTPVPVEELNSIIHIKRTKLPVATLVGGLTGMASGFALQYWVSVIEYP